MLAESKHSERIGKLCKVEGVVAIFGTCPLEPGLTPSKRSGMEAFQLCATGDYQRLVNTMSTCRMKYLFYSAGGGLINVLVMLDSIAYKPFDRFASNGPCSFKKKSPTEFGRKKQ